MIVKKHNCDFHHLISAIITKIGNRKFNHTMTFTHVSGFSFLGLTAVLLCSRFSITSENDSPNTALSGTTIRFPLALVKKP